MRYNLFLKKATSNWEEAKKMLLESKSIDSNRVKKDYIVPFPYNYKYDPEINFVYEGELTGAYRIKDDFTLYFLNEREQVEEGYRTLGMGEVVEGDTIKSIPSPGAFYIWGNGTWVYEKELEIDSINSKIKTIESDLERTQAKLDSREKLGMYIEDLKNEISELLQRHSEECHKLTLIK